MGVPAGAEGLDETRIARAALTRLIEPGDATGAMIVAALGPTEGLRVATGSQQIDPAIEARLRSVLIGRGAKAWEGVAAAVERWRSRVPDLAPHRDLETIARFGGRFVIPEDSEWPDGFGDLGEQAPHGLWVRGEEHLPSQRSAVAIVGSRNATNYGLSVAGEISKGLVDRGVTVVSGGAYGIDAQAHRAALVTDGRGLPTVAVMAGGLDRYYPSGNEQLLREVARRGLLVSELPPGGAPTRHRFLRRNRLIAALTGVTVVVEAQWRSGARSTAHHAADIGRVVAAVPGSVYSASSAGCHRLLRDGAAVCVTDVQEVYELLAPAGEGLAGEREGHVAIHDGLAVEDFLLLDALPVKRGAGIDSLSTVAGLSAAQVRAGLGRLQLMGLCQQTAGGWRKTDKGGSAK
ncbi:DNA-processing protein DprA [Sinomonas sp. 5-5]|uniref:DNA-processing protein DprA n=1 Tax=Sinomonas terrae TaxID=2908838 RepID=A0ABS9TZT2_9MICC|nr:DNA-processing protein DprA [Sinomonas terrae]